MDHSSYKHLKVECRSDGIAIVTLNRPQRRNAINPEMHEELETLFLQLPKDEAIRCVVLTGAGEGFCAGGDAQVLRKGEWRSEGQGIPLGEVRRLAMNILELEQPIVAAVNGDAAGLGATLALFCDIIVAADDARIGDAHVKMGMVAGDGGVVIWPLLVGMARAKECLLLGRWITGEEAQRIGLVNYAVPRDQVMRKALEVAEEFAQGAPLAIRFTKFCLNKILREQANLVMDTSAILESITLKSEDVREAADAFLAKRRLTFRGV